MRSTGNAVVYSSIIYSLFLMSTPAQSATAQPILLLKEPMGDATDVMAQFEVNRELGRAWIRIDFWDEGDEIPSVVRTERKAVEGLSYDPSTKRVVYRTGAETIICAEDSQFLWMKSLTPTGNCPIRASTEERIVDDGFETSKQSMAEVLMAPPKSNELVSHAR
jgi:hypothetical protein